MPFLSFRGQFLIFNQVASTTTSYTDMYIHSLVSKWTYLTQTIPDIDDLLQQLEDTIHQHFLPTLTGQNPFNDTERDLMALPAHLGGLGITNPVNQAPSQHRTSKKVMAPQKK